MHEYSVNTNRVKIIYYLVFLSTILAAFFANLLSMFPWSIKAPITTSLVFTGVFWVFNKFAWRWLAKYIGTPDLNGKWQGELRSSYNYNTTYPVTLTITQTWTRICIRGKFSASGSSSLIASIKTDDAETKLFYAYKNDGDIETKLDGHDGYTTLIFDQTRTELNGTYFNNRLKDDKHNSGKMTLRKIE